MFEVLITYSGKQMTSGCFDSKALVDDHQNDITSRDYILALDFWQKLNF